MADSSSVAALDTLLHKSQRVSHSCLECTRRKIKCNKTVPCGPCYQRGAAHQCRRASPSEGKTLPRLAANEVATAIVQLQTRVSELERRLAGTTTPSQVPPLPNQNYASPSSTQVSVRPPSFVTTSPTSPHEEVEQAVTLEYLALGKDRNRGILGPLTRSLHTDSAPASNILHRPLSIPIDPAISHALLSSQQLDFVLAYHLDQVAWQHACIHVPTFQMEVDSFMRLPTQQRWEKTDPLWLALFFVIQSIAVHQMPYDTTAAAMGWRSTQDQGVLCAKLLDAALRSFNVGRFLFEPSFYSCQAIAILCVCGHNVTDSNLLSNLLAIGIKTAQTLNLHVLGHEDRRMRAMSATNHTNNGTSSSAWQQRVLALEMGKRIWWSLVQQDYFAIPFRGVSLVHPRDHDTPIPSNLTEEDLSSGCMEQRSEQELTLVSKLRFTSQTADVVCRFFQNLPRDSSEGVPTLESHIMPYESTLFDMLPSSVRGFRTSDSTYKFGAALRRYLNVSLRHKVLVLHRAFCSRNPSSSEWTRSQDTCLEMSHQILEHCRAMQSSIRPEGPVTAVWTISYHAVAAASALGLQLFATQSVERGHSITREEVQEAQKVLEGLAPRSAIASRGVELLESLLKKHEELELQRAEERTPRKRARG